jgi:hypothetical protein
MPTRTYLETWTENDLRNALGQNIRGKGPRQWTNEELNAELQRRDDSETPIKPIRIIDGATTCNSVWQTADRSMLMAKRTR